jgi:hypothetical protein
MDSEAPSCPLGCPWPDMVEVSSTIGGHGVGGDHHQNMVRQSGTGSYGAGEQVESSIESVARDRRHAPECRSAQHHGGDSAEHSRVPNGKPAEGHNRGARPLDQVATGTSNGHHSLLFGQSPFV